MHQHCVWYCVSTCDIKVHGPRTLTLTVKMRSICLFLIFATLLLSYPVLRTSAAPKDIEDKLCPGTQSYYRDNNRIFSNLGQRCSIENDAYVFGALISQYSATSKSFEQGTLPERWTNFAYLDASTYDSPGKNPPKPPVVSSCIFNQRLAKQQSTSGVLKVALSCNPFELTYCRTEYDDSLTINSRCDCNYLYSIKEKTASGSFKCIAKAGVPCIFNQDPSITDPFLKLPTSTDCHSSLICRNVSKEQQRKTYQKAFHGFGITPIAYEYMIENAAGYCDCSSPSHTINELNECVERSNAIVWHTQRHKVTLYFIGFTISIFRMAML